jgi:hypothetical protein
MRTGPICNSTTWLLKSVGNVEVFRSENLSIFEIRLRWPKSTDEVHSSPYLNMRMSFIALRKGIFLKPFRGARTKRNFKHGKERNLLVDESANLAQQG